MVIRELLCQLQKEEDLISQLELITQQEQRIDQGWKDI